MAGKVKGVFGLPDEHRKTIVEAAVRRAADVSRAASWASRSVKLWADLRRGSER